MGKRDLLPYFRSKNTILRMFPKRQWCGKNALQRHVYVDNGSPILLVAHIDTVQRPRLVRFNKGAGFDDRLGVFAAHKLVQKYPKWFDLLLTDFEECMGSTARFFTPSHSYNLIVELDREGEDYVDYGLASHSLKETLASFGFKLGIGSFTDICSMSHVPSNKVNIGLGTYHSHSRHSGFNVGTFHRQISRLLSFVRHHRKTTWPLPPIPDKPKWYSAYHSQCSIDDRDSDIYVPLYDSVPSLSSPGEAECDSCGIYLPVDMLTYDFLYEGHLCDICQHLLYSPQVR